MGRASVAVELWAAAAGVNIRQFLLSKTTSGSHIPVFREYGRAESLSGREVNLPWRVQDSMRIASSLADGAVEKDLSAGLSILKD
jgi:hypothetical protein